MLAQSNVERVLVVEDDPKLRDILKTYGKVYGYEMIEAIDGKQALEIMDTMDFSAVLLDVMMPNIDGWTVLREIRTRSTTPVILLTARGEEYDRLFGFDLGCDDYVVKPFSPKEVMARLKVVIKRNKGNSGGSQGALRSEGPMATDQGSGSGNVLNMGDLYIDKAARVVKSTQNSQILKLTPKEYDLLVYFATNPGIALSRAQILDAVWGFDFYGDDRTVDTHVKMLRESLGPLKSWLVTVWGTGYRFEPRSAGKEA